MKQYLRVALVLTLPAVAILFFISQGAGEGYKYDAHGKRDPLVPLVGIDSPAISRLEDITSIADIKLEGIASRSRGRLIAILNGEIVNEGDKFGSIEIKKITKKSVTINIDGKSFDKSIVEEGGVKSVQ